MDDRRQPTSFLVVGGGILGLATARQLSIDQPGSRVVVLEKEGAVARHQTGRNSGVVHAGVYYAPGSLKADLCRRGVALLEAYCAEHAIPLEHCGKVVVATREAERPALDELFRRSVANGVPQVRMLDAGGLREVEPHAVGIAALHSPTTAIVDFGLVARAMAAEIVAGGGEVRLGAQVVSLDHGGGPGAGRPAAVLSDGTRVLADRIVVCAGVHTDRLAAASGAPADPRIVPFRGEYYALRPERTHLVRGLIYPVPDPALPFLGVHLTRRIDGAVLVGPNAVPALGRESLRWRDPDLRGTAELLRARSTRRLMRAQWRTGFTELRRSASRRRFVEDARRYVPALSTADVVRARAGIRAQAVDPDGTLVDDFRLDAVGPVAWVRNAPSPAATSSMAIAEELVARLGLRRA